MKSGTYKDGVFTLEVEGDTQAEWWANYVKVHNIDVSKLVEPTHDFLGNLIKKEV